MLIPNPARIQNEKGLLLLMVLDILRRSTDAAHPMSKQELLKRIEHDYGFKPARGTLNEKLNALEQAGFDVIQDGREGVYYDGADLSDGELRFLIDSVMYSTFTTRQGADDMISALMALGTPTFQKQMKGYTSRTERTRKNKQTDVFSVLEKVQEAINDRKQIRCNYFSYTETLETELVYPESIVINPYELAYKNGRYYLFGALSGNENMLSWRVDRLCDVGVLDSKRLEIPLCREIKDSGGWAAYIDAQPELSGGKVETFKLQCARDAIDEVVDAFGRDFVIAPEQTENIDPDTVIIAVRATRESMKVWAIAHSGSIVVLSPENFRDEIIKAFQDAQHLYHTSKAPLNFRLLFASSLEEAVKLTSGAGKRFLTYHGRRPNRKQPCEVIDTSLLARVPFIQRLSLSNCDAQEQIFTDKLPLLSSLRMYESAFSLENLMFTPLLTELLVSRLDDSAVPKLLGLTKLHTLALADCSFSDYRFVMNYPGLKKLELYHNENLTDYSFLSEMPDLEWLKIYDERTDWDYTFLRKMKKLRRVVIDSPRIGEKEAEELQKLLPHCRVSVRTLPFSGARR